MFQPSVLALFLYFPEDKSEYIPAVISLTIFMIAAFFTMRFIIKISKREALKAKELEEQIKNNHFTQRDS
ncbi:hypothetical protein ACIQXV_18955 [Neobacillus sp. NPDC097160]|uniref:Uncharacterized protein n=1 Tax=Bacillus salipaludis TaxID=2547811 RepID=A0ABW8RC08_9BACI